MTNKKVIDILPPEKRKKFIARKKEKTLPLNKRQPRLFFSPWLKKILIFFLFCLILAAGFCYFVLSKAEIELWPETRFISLKKNLIVDQDEVQAFEEEITLSKLFQSSGEILKEEKAKGIIKVYNEYSTSPQTLVASTRFVSSDGKVFRTPVNVTIPGGQYEGGKLVPGEIDIEVVADEPGSQYNIGPTTFSIPGFAGTERYTKFYAKSFEAMSGGLYEEKARITEEDLTAAEQFLAEEAETKCRETLRNKFSLPDLSDKFYYFSEEIETEIIDKFSLSAAGEEKKEFTFQAKAKCKTLSLEKEFLSSYAENVIKAEISPDESLFKESLDIKFLDREVDHNQETISFSLEISARIYSTIDFQQLQNALAGKSANESQALLKSQPQIIKADVNLWPFWTRKIPNDSDKINFFLRFD